jgi:hypothetical protein
LIRQPEPHILPAPLGDDTRHSDQRKEALKGRGLLFQRGVDGGAEPVVKRRRPVLSEPLAVVFAMPRLWVFNYGQAVLGAEKIAAFPQGAARTKKVAPLPFAVERG